MNTSQNTEDLSKPPHVSPGDWIETTCQKWMRVSKVYNVETIECLCVDDSRGEGYRRDFVFLESWWRSRYPDPDGGYLPIHRRKSVGEVIKSGPPHRIISNGNTHYFEYLQSNGSVWRCPRHLIDKLHL